MKRVVRIVAPYIRSPQGKHVVIEIRDLTWSLSMFNHQLIFRGNQVVEHRDGRVIPRKPKK